MSKNDENNNEVNKLDTQPYKGVRDFYPEDLRIRSYIFNIWRKTMASFGYEEYDASIFEPADLYRAKSGDEIVNEQTYTFTDRGDREVTLRPEMTPTVARLVAGRVRELGYPLRLFSIPNLFRYERPQRGRLREHWQLNTDIFGDSTNEAEIELIAISSKLLQNFGLTNNQFSIKISSRRLINAIMADWYELDEAKSKQLSKLIDKKSKMTEEEFDTKAREIVGPAFKFLTLSHDSETYQEATSILSIKEALAEVNEVITTLNKRGIPNVHLDTELVRGFDYYTGIIFEMFDTHEANNRSLFGGGRYDRLVGMFGVNDMPAAGFGMGDVTMKDVLETYDLIPSLPPSTQLCLISLSPEFIDQTISIANTLREQGLNIATDTTDKKIGDKIKNADKLHIPHVTVIGKDEVDTETLKIKTLKDSSEIELKVSDISSHFLK